MDNSLRNFVKNIKNLPTIPIVAHEILGLIGKDLLSVDKLEDIIEKDPAISAKILSVANSALFGFQASTDVLRFAIMKIGFNNVKNVALGVSLMTILDDGKRGKSFDYHRIFSHSIAVGYTSRILSTKLKMDLAEEMLVNGMLHDLGFLVLNRYFHETYQEVLFNFEEGMPLLEAEKKVFDFTHADIGHWLAEEWKLPAIIQDVNLYHHTPGLAKKHEKHVAMIHIADYLTTKNVLSPIEKDPYYKFDEVSLEILGISESELKDIEETIGGIPFSDEIFK